MFEFNSHLPLAIINQMANVQVFVLIHWSIINVIIIFFFVHSGETGRNNWGGSCKEKSLLRRKT